MTNSSSLPQLQPLPPSPGSGAPPRLLLPSVPHGTPQHAGYTGGAQYMHLGYNQQEGSYSYPLGRCALPWPFLLQSSKETKPETQFCATNCRGKKGSLTVPISLGGSWGPARPAQAADAGAKHAGPPARHPVRQIAHCLPETRSWTYGPGFLKIWLGEF